MVRLSSAAGGSGGGVAVAVIDSGVHAQHPHVQGVAGGVGIDHAGREHDDYVDRLGHGTAVTAVIREKAPDAGVHAVKVFDRELAATAVALQAAIEWSVRRQVRIINLSLGTRNAEHEAALGAAVEAAARTGVVIIAAGEQEGVRWLPGSLPGVVAVQLDWALPRDECDVTLSGGAIVVRASGYPRPIPGVSPERNLKGLSFAVANATGLLVRCLSAAPSTDSIESALRAWINAVNPGTPLGTPEPRNPGT